MAYFASYGLFKLYGTYVDVKDSHRKQVVLWVIIIVLMTSVIGNSMNEIDKVVSKHGVFSYVIHEDTISGSMALKKCTPENTMVISYSSTYKHRWMNSLSLKSFYLLLFHIPTIVEDIFKVETADSAYKNVQELLMNKSIDSEYYLSGMEPYQYNLRDKRGRQQAEKNRNLSVVLLITKEDLNALSPGAINKFYNETYFTVLYEDEKYRTYIFGVNPKPGVPFKLQN